MTWRLDLIRRLQRNFALALMMLLSACVHASGLQVAVASNFSGPMKIIAAVFEKESGHKLRLAFGATGQFYAQIRNGAPFAVLLAADDETPQRLIRDGHAVEDSAFTYATGRLVLWSKKPGFVDSKGEILKSDAFARLAIANPKLAPYGAAAIETLSKLGLLERIAPKLVEASNIAQAFQFVASENAALGFVAMSQVFENGVLKEGSAWIVPNMLHAPIHQNAVLLNPGKNDPTALALINFLKTESAKSMIRSFGYHL